MNIEGRIEALQFLHEYLGVLDNLKEVKELAFKKNRWFVPKEIDKALIAIRDSFLNREILDNVVNKYGLHNVNTKNKIGLVLAGNIPLVGFHDILCNFVSNQISIIKLSEKDNVLIPHLLKILTDRFPELSSYFVTVDKLKDYDAVVATGSNNTSRYFYQYFSHVPHLIRKNRSSIAILGGNESSEEIKGLENDVFDYFGLGCRNISKLFVPVGYTFDNLLTQFSSRNDVMLHNKYANNYEYNLALYLMNKSNILQNETIILKEDKNVASRIACLNYEYYSDKIELSEEINSISGQLQCISTNITFENLQTISLGMAQKPSFFDYADGVDTIQFLLSLS